MAHRSILPVIHNSKILCCHLKSSPGCTSAIDPILSDHWLLLGFSLDIHCISQQVKIKFFLFTKYRMCITLLSLKLTWSLVPEELQQTLVITVRLLKDLKPLTVIVKWISLNALKIYKYKFKGMYQKIYSWKGISFSLQNGQKLQASCTLPSLNPDPIPSHASLETTLGDVIVGFWPWLEACTIAWWNQIERLVAVCS